jgi:hypothetical protein
VNVGPAVLSPLVLCRVFDLGKHVRARAIARTPI